MIHIYIDSLCIEYLCNGGDFLKVDKELLNGTTDILVLSLLEEKAMYGYQIIKEMDKRSEGIFDLKEGTLYPLLHKLEGRGLLRSYWDSGDGNRKRKYYSITPKGKEYILDKKKEWSIYAKTVKKVLGGEFAWI